MHLTSSPIDWYAVRAAGIVAYLLLTAVVALGLGLAGKVQRPRWPRFAVEDVHRFGGLLVGAFIAIHVLTIAFDSFLSFSLAELAVPFASRYRPVWVGTGIVAAELLVALAVANRFRRRLPYGFWRRAHYLNAVVWLAATVHGVGSGTDRSAPWLVATFAISAGLVVGLAGWRILRRALPGAPVPNLALGAAGVAAACTVGFVALGPLRFEPRPWNAATFRDRLSGRIEIMRGVGGGIVSLAGEGRGRQRVLVRADLLSDTSTWVSSSLQVEYLPGGDLCVGRLTHVESYRIEGRCSLQDGSTRAISASWKPAGMSELHGTIVSRG